VKTVVRILAILFVGILVVAGVSVLQDRCSSALALERAAHNEAEAEANDLRKENATLKQERVDLQDEAQESAEELRACYEGKRK
jgi:uncharacterized protein YlxW (UPF0749 family)